jgi:hypothetical protein
MEKIKADTEGGFNAFLADQKALPGEATITLITFDDVVEVEYSMLPIQDAPTFTLRPRGWTALLDAVGVTIQKLGQSLEAMDEADRPEKVVVVIITDGDENKSREYTFEQIGALIKAQADTYKWEFMFLGANQDAIMAGGRLGIDRGKSMSFAISSTGVANSYSSASSNVSSYRSSNDPGAAMCDFSLEDRSKSMAQDPTT